MSELLDCVVMEPRGATKASVLWLHGLGADGRDFEPIVPYLNVNPDLGVRFIFPNAPNIPVTINQGMVMPAWYDITDQDLNRRNDEDGIRRSARRVRSLIAREREDGVPSRKIVLAGFSQGGAVALFEGLRHPEPLAGILALSTYLVLEASLEAERAEANAKTPVFIGHGTHDPMVPVAGGERARDRLTELGHPVSFHAYPMRHEVSPQEIEDIGAWLNRVLGAD